LTWLKNKKGAICHMIAPCLLIGHVTANCCVMKKTSIRQPSCYWIYADSSQPKPDTSLSNLMLTAD